MQFNLNFEYGLLYEKEMFAKIVGEIVEKYNIRTVCEYPSNNLMGDNCEIFFRLGCKTEKMKFFPLNYRKKFDLVWNFCEVERARNPARMIDDMLNLTRSYILIITQNKNNIGVRLHKIYHKLRGTIWDHGDINYMNCRAVLNLIKNKAKLIKIGAFDVPWFVLDFYEGGEPLRKIVPKRLIPKDPKLIRPTYLERRLPKVFKYVLAHHHYLLLRKI